MLDTLVSKYIMLRDKRDTLKNSIKEQVAKMDHALDLAEAAILAELHKVGAESFRTPSGTAYKTTRASCTVAEWDPLLAFIRENEAWDMLDKRVNKTGVEQYRAENNDLPPGVKWTEETVVNVRRS